MDVTAETGPGVPFCPSQLLIVTFKVCFVSFPNSLAKSGHFIKGTSLGVGLVERPGAGRSERVHHRVKTFLSFKILCRRFPQGSIQCLFWESHERLSPVFCIVNWFFKQ